MINYRRRATHGIKDAKDCGFKKGLHCGKASADDPGVGLDGGPDGEVDEIICGGGISFVIGENLDLRTGKVNGIFMDGCCV